MTAPRWHFGRRIIPGGKKKPWWSNRWLTHPCADLAIPFEIGVRAASPIVGTLDADPDHRANMKT